MNKRLLAILTAVMITSTGLPVAAPMTVYAEPAEGSEEVVTPEATPETTPETTPEVNPDQTPEPEVNPEGNPDQNPEKDPEVNPDQNPETDPEATPEGNPDQNPEKDPEVNPNQNHEKDPETNPELNPDGTTKELSKDGLTTQVVSDAKAANGIMLFANGPEGDEEEEKSNVEKFKEAVEAFSNEDRKDVDELTDEEVTQWNTWLKAAGKAYDLLTKEEEQEVKGEYEDYDTYVMWFHEWEYNDQYATDPIDDDEHTTLRRSHLSSRDQVIYDAMDDFFGDVAEGRVEHTVLTINLNDLVDSKISEDEKDAICHLNQWSSHEASGTPGEKDTYVPSQFDNWAERIYWAVQDDNPYNLYWELNYLIADLDQNEDGDDVLTMKFGVGVEYRLSAEDCADKGYAEDEAEFTFNTGSSLVDEARQAYHIAEEIAAEAYDMDAEDAIRYYNDRICSLVSYDNISAGSKAVEGSLRSANVINTFDLDPDTNIVCAGYAKSMVFLFQFWKAQDQNEDVDVDLYYITGSAIEESKIATGPNNDGHAWNVVRTTNGNGVIDTTHYDESDGKGGFMTKAYLTETDNDNVIKTSDEDKGVANDRTKIWWWGDVDDKTDIHTHEFNIRGKQTTFPALDLFNAKEMDAPYQNAADLF